jgi:hypothetical protein
MREVSDLPSYQVPTGLYCSSQYKWIFLEIDLLQNFRSYLNLLNFALILAAERIVWAPRGGGE